ncbi:MAG: type II toxin-antitoxin system VapC family toxin [Oscillatoriales cyanobacterium C42_A2020_001]|nr:type II toxin-antitoxin system VapC family toxin [Leptolyngbyaceae cyanobacterium C42_A2020_001]
MQPTMVDTDILSLFFRGESTVITKFESYLQQYNSINLSLITYYEILSGLKHRDAHRQFNLFLDFAAQNIVLPLTKESVSISADIYADLRKKGSPIDDIDILIAGIAMNNNLILA